LFSLALSDYRLSKALRNLLCGASVLIGLFLAYMYAIYAFSGLTEFIIITEEYVFYLFSENCFKNKLLLSIYD
jgi:hypothetical protein